ncbi:reverse transcriptase domain-containing protein, partial [Tanacetum coccineum]
MADNHIMAQMLQAPIEGYEDAIVVPPINANNFELKQTLINLVQSNQFTEGEARDWLDKEPSRSILTWDDLVLKFINQFFPPSKTTYLRNEITTFYQKPNETFNEAWERFKGLLRQCPHHGFSELHQLDMFYNSLNTKDQDALDSAASCNFLDKMPREGVSKTDFESYAKANDANMNNLQMKLDRYSKEPKRFSKSLHEFSKRNKLIFQKLMLSFMQNYHTNQASSSSSLPSNTIPNPRNEAKAITTRSGASYDGPPIPPPVVEKEPEVTKDTELPSTEDIQPPLVGKVLISARRLLFLDFIADLRYRVILRETFLRTTHALIEVVDHNKVLDFSVSVSYGNPSPYFDLIVSNSSPTLTPFEESDFLLFEEVDAFIAIDDEPISTEIDATYYDPEGDILILKAFLNSDPLPPPPHQRDYLMEIRRDLKIVEPKKSSIEYAISYEPKSKPPKVKLKDLPTHLEYAFLADNNKLPVIIAKDLSDDEKTALIKVLKSRKQAIAWKLSDIKGINPKFCSHKILMEDDYEPMVQHQRRVNPKIHDVIKKEVEKLLDAGLIYPISDSPWVSPVHCVPKKGGMTIVTNDENELVPTRLVTRWRVCIDYPTGGHYSANIIAQKVFDAGFFWPTIYKDAYELMKSCDAIIDFMGPFSSSRENKYILVVVNYLSKWVEAKALPTNDARVVVKFLKSLFSRFDTPRSIISDRRTHFCNDKFDNVMSKYGVTYRLSIAYHPQTSGQVEVTNRGPQRILKGRGEKRPSRSRQVDDALWHFEQRYKDYNRMHALQAILWESVINLTSSEDSRAGVVLSPGFKLADESQVLLKVPRKNNMYSVDMKNIIPKESLTCLVAKATLDESILWHRRLGHVNFKTINKLVKENLVRDLPTKHFENDQTCIACLKGKQHKASSSKDETSSILKNFIIEIENLVDKKVKIIRCDNGTEFKNRVM